MHKETSYIINYDHEVNNKKDWIEFHIGMLHLDAIQIRNALFIFKTVDDEINRRYNNKIKTQYSQVRTIIYESLTYRIVLGLSKLLVRSKDYTLLKVCNIISQMDEYKHSIEVKHILKKNQLLY